MDVGHLGTAHPLVDPAHDIAQDALRIVVQLVGHVLLGPVGAIGQRRRQQVCQAGRRPLGDLLLDREHVDRMIMQRVQGRRRRRGRPGGVGPRLRMADLLLQHVGHAVGRRPHTLADLGLARQAAGQTDGDIPRLIGRDPGRALDLGLPDHRPRLHGGVDLVAGAVQEAGVDEDDPVLNRVDAGRQVGRGAPLLVHHPDLDRVPGQTQQVLHRIEQAIGEARLLRPMHLGLDDIDRARRRVGEAA